MKLKVHTRVRHKEYGEGKINKITPEKVYVAFNGKIFIFDLPEAFENDYLIPIEDEIEIERKEQPEEVRTENKREKKSRLKQRKKRIKCRFFVCRW